MLYVSFQAFIDTIIVVLTKESAFSKVV